MQGTRQIVERSLHNNIELSLQKLHSGMAMKDIVELHQNSITVEGLNLLLNKS